MEVQRGNLANQVAANMAPFISDLNPTPTRKPRRTSKG
jgi:hypothetical protein